MSGKSIPSITVKASYKRQKKLFSLNALYKNLGLAGPHTMAHERKLKNAATKPALYKSMHLSREKNTGK